MLYAIGDIHGQFDKLDQLLKGLPLDPDDTLVFIGDYIDRGPDSSRVLQRLIELKVERPNTICLRGNHEQMMLDALGHFQPQPGLRDLGPDLALMWFHNGADATLASYPEPAPRWSHRIPDNHWEFVKATPIEHVTRRYHFVHAGLRPAGYKWTDSINDPRLWIRDPFLLSSQDFGKIVVFGHTPLQSVLVQENKIGIDTGATFGGPLTAVAIDDSVPFHPNEVVVCPST